MTDFQSCLPFSEEFGASAREVELYLSLCKVPSSSGLSQSLKFVDMSNFTIPYKCYPPPSNKDYTLTTDGHNPKFVRIERTSSLHKSGFSVEHRDQDPESNNTMKSAPRPFLDAERFAKTIQWHKYNFNSGTCESNGPIYPADQARADFIKMINDGAQFEHCIVCDKKHICPGPPITLPDRDKCGAYLPRWFPRERFTKPWNTYLELLNNIAMLESYEHNPKAVWDKQLHDADARWAPLGREAGGWWNCRWDSDAIQAERDCQLCNRDRTSPDWEQAQQQQRRGIMDRLNTLKEWKDKQMQETADRDKAIALAMIRDQPTGMKFLTPPPAEPIPPLRIPYDSDDEEGDWTLGPYGGQIPWKGKGKVEIVVEEDLRGSESPDLKPIELHLDMSVLNLNELAFGDGLNIYDGQAVGAEDRGRTRAKTVGDLMGKVEVERGRRLARGSFSSATIGPSKKLLLR